MDQSLLKHFSHNTHEENLLLRGDPLQQNVYTNRRFFIVEGSLFMPDSRLIGLRQHTRYTPFPIHWHDYLEVMYVLNGEVIHLMGDDITLRVKKGELLFINRHNAHHLLACSEKDVAVNFMIMPAFLNFISELYESESALASLLLDTLRNHKKGPGYLHFQIADHPSLQRLLESIVYTLIENQYPSTLIYQEEMKLLFLHLLKHPNCMVAPENEQHQNPLVVKMLREMNENYFAFSLQSFAKKHHVSSAYLCRIIKETTGSTCVELLQQIRMEKARDLLSQTNLTIIEISTAVGYSNNSYFYRLFKNCFGKSPAQLRLEYQNRN